MSEIPMAGYENEAGQYIKGIEDEVKAIQYDRDEHREMVVKDIFDNWLTLSQNGKFHAIFATSSIVEAIKYYRLIKKERPNLKITALFDSNIDNGGDKKGEGALFKEDGLLEIMEDYNKLYGQDFNLTIHDKFKKDISSRLSHKKPYERIEKDEDAQLNLLIVVDQMLTGFDSKWVNTLYLDKILKYENIIQAFSRTNRLFGPDKPFGVIRYYRYPNSMERNIEEAVKYYSGDRKVDLFVEHPPSNLKKMNGLADDIKYLFERAGVANFEKLPEDLAERGQFAKLFSKFSQHFEAAKVQGFTWEEKKYTFEDGQEIEITIDEQSYLAMVQRYKELAKKVIDDADDLPFDIDGYLTEIDTGKIDTNYMNSRFEKYLKDLSQKNIDPQELQNTLNELHKSFASLSQEEQKFANIFLHDIERGEAELVEGKTFREYITQYQLLAKNKQVMDLHEAIGVDVGLLEKFLESKVSEKNINEYGRFVELEKTVDKDRAKVFLEKRTGKSIPMFIVNRDIAKLLRDFVLSGGFEIHEKKEYKESEVEELLERTSMVAEDSKA